MPKKKAGVSRREVLTLTSAAVAGVVVSSWPVGPATAPDVVGLPIPPPMDLGGELKLSPVFADIVPRMEALWTAHTEGAARYERVDPEVTRLRYSHNEADLDIYCAHPDVRAYRRAVGALHAALWTAVNAPPKTFMDCDAQEWCERLFQEAWGDDYGDWERWAGARMMAWRQWVRAKDDKELKRRLLAEYSNGRMAA